MSENNSPKLNNDEIIDKKETEISSEEIEESQSSTKSNELKADNTVDETPQKKKSLAKDIIESIELIAISFAVIVILFSLVFRVCTVSGESMENTLDNGDVVICSNLFYTPQRQDIVVVHVNRKTDADGNLLAGLDEPIVKRVIGLPGDTVNIVYLPNNQMKVTVINEKTNESFELVEDYVKKDSCSQPHSIKHPETFVVGEGEIFVMGDNRYHSADSRDPRIGIIDSRRVLGRIIFRVSPLDKIGTVS